MASSDLRVFRQARLGGGADFLPGAVFVRVKHGGGRVCRAHEDKPQEEDYSFSRRHFSG